MSNDYGDLLREHFSEILENLAFMFVEDTEDGKVPGYPGAAVEVAMGFKGPFTGELVMAVPEEMCPELAANVLGLNADDELILNNPYDALKELLNVTCGNMLTAIAGEEPVFDLSIPEVKPLDEAEWQELAASEGVVGAVADDQPVLLRLTTTQ